MRIHARHGIVGLSRLGITLAACVCTALGTATAATPSDAATAPGDVHTQTLLIGQSDREAFGIKEVRWVEGSGLTGFAYILGCFACGPASYTSDGELADSGSLPKIPTSYILRVPENYGSKLLVNIPPGTSTQTFFRPRHQQLLADGFAVAVVDHPMPGFPGFPSTSSSSRRTRPPTTAASSLPPGICSATCSPRSIQPPPLRTRLGTLAASWPESGCSPTAPTGHSTATSWCRAATETSPI